MDRHHVNGAVSGEPPYRHVDHPESTSREEDRQGGVAIEDGSVEEQQHVDGELIGESQHDEQIRDAERRVGPARPAGVCWNLYSRSPQMPSGQYKSGNPDNRFDLEHHQNLIVTGSSPPANPPGPWHQHMTSHCPASDLPTPPTAPVHVAAHGHGGSLVVGTGAWVGLDRQCSRPFSSNASASVAPAPSVMSAATCRPTGYPAHVTPDALSTQQRPDAPGSSTRRHRHTRFSTARPTTSATSSDTLDHENMTDARSTEHLHLDQQVFDPSGGQVRSRRSGRSGTSRAWVPAEDVGYSASENPDGPGQDGRYGSRGGGSNPAANKMGSPRHIGAQESRARASSPDVEQWLDQAQHRESLCELHRVVSQISDAMDEQ